MRVGFRREKWTMATIHNQRRGKREQCTTKFLLYQKRIMVFSMLFFTLPLHRAYIFLILIFTTTFKEFNVLDIKANL
jgi:hypothetical protein